MYGDDLWKVCHAPASMRPAVGQLMVEATRHFLDYSETTDEEAAQIGPLMRRLYAALRSVTGAERVYSAVLLEGVPHFHLHLVPRPADAPSAGWPICRLSPRRATPRSPRRSPCWGGSWNGRGRPVQRRASRSLRLVLDQ